MKLSPKEIAYAYCANEIYSGYPCGTPDCPHGHEHAKETAAIIRLSPSAAAMLAEMRANPGLRLRCRWVEHDAKLSSPEHAKGGWGFLGCGPVLGTTADVRALHDAGFLENVEPWHQHAERQRLEWMQFMLKGRGK